MLGAIAGDVIGSVHEGARVPEDIQTQTMARLDERLRDIVTEFVDRYGRRPAPEHFWSVALFLERRARRCG